jgi:hypothetical protein
MQLQSTALSHPQLSSYSVDQSKTTCHGKYWNVKQLRRWLADYYSGRLRRNTTITYRNTKPLQPLKPGQSISIQDPRTQIWKPAEIKENIQEVPRSYIITKPGGGNIRRNRTQIRERPQDPMEQAYQEPGEKTLDNPEILSPKSTQESHQYTTRSGRIVVPPTRLDM